MPLLRTRLEKLEARLTDRSHLIVYSPAWFDYWGEKLDRLDRGEDDPERIPLEYVDALLSDSEGIARVEQ